MLVRDSVVVVTGGGRGIGAALARRFAAEGAAGVLVSDLDGDAAQAVAESLEGTKALAVRADVADEAQVTELVRTAERELGPIDLFCSNAGIGTGHTLEESTAEDWSRAWSVNLLSHVHAARAVLPSMLARGRGYLLNTASAAGLLIAPGDPAYTATKHAAVGFAEYLSVTYGSRGIKVSALCPMGVRTDLLMPGVEQGNLSALAVAASGEILEPDEVAGVVVQGLAEERFLILPHPEVAKFVERKAVDRDRWLAGMRRNVDQLPQQ
ncbi:SDR family oxidoreductase [Kutzneria viridogrisea]|uniref:Short-chain dehydrogenase/reductase SDR n=2 Tax=Kutzneria TaxID=43356 RepID=W5WBG2_9PSEU|nr:SDR family oxidoreductase [Kutzneria albida]AHH95559.1 short-chain dehydrogenase/reductase SDR [Kutzneria albida DSM 43870]MBA8927079.1 NAD(P)-dependent dehydrogenase (short-subunit alcohol dehydrogenase family) [Kutzneria viridogrisea]